MMKPLYLQVLVFPTNCLVRLVLSVIDSSIDNFGYVTGDRQIGFVQEYLCTQLPNALNIRGARSLFMANTQRTQTDLQRRKQGKRAHAVGKRTGYLG